MQLFVLGMASGSRSLRDVEQLGKELWGRRMYRLREAPSDSTLGRVAQAVSATELCEVLASQVWDMRRSKQLEVNPEIGISLVAVDGKRFGTSDEQTHPDAIAGGGEEQRYYQVHGLRAVHVASDVKPVLGQFVVRHSEHEGEAAAFRPFYDWLLSHYGAFVECVSMDAGFLSMPNLLRMNLDGVGYIVALKGNAAKVHAWALERLGEGDGDPPEGWEVQATEGRGTSKEMTRCFSRVRAELKSVGWGGIATEVWRIRQTGKRDGKMVTENRYYLTNLPWGRLTGKQALAAIRSHWGIENDCNWTLDTQLHEDTETWVNRGRASEVLAVLRMIAYNLLRVCRHRALRAASNRTVPWRTLLCWMRVALVTPCRVWEPDGIG